MENWLKTPIYAPRIFQQAVVALLMGLYIFFVLAVFQPFGTYNYQDPIKLLRLSGYGVVTALAYFSLSTLVIRFSGSHWTRLNELGLMALLISGTSLACMVYFKWVIYPDADWFLAAIGFMGYGSCMSLFPALFYFYVRQNETIRPEKAINPPSETQHPTKATLTHLILLGTNKDEQLVVNPQEVAFLKAADNYVEVHLDKGNGLVLYLLRNSLQAVLQQFPQGFLQQCHRSYAVNLSFRPEIQGLSPKFVLHFWQFKIDIPLSKTFADDIKKALKNLPV